MNDGKIRVGIMGLGQIGRHLYHLALERDDIEIVAVADIFDALTAHRPYREPDADQVVLGILRKDAEQGKLDSGAVAALERELPRIVEIRGEINERIHRSGGVLDLREILLKEDTG